MTPCLIKNLWKKALITSEANANNVYILYQFNDRRPLAEKPQTKRLDEAMHQFCVANRI